ncbi:hypothetical protein HR09_01520 [Porphyromonas gulae]|uniref:DUF1896 family protein n=1 Tax=Porphyromonas gulae TaxID=111105 RepID=UPI00052B9AB6|nr:DUF1896 family protein [Porphyromonas gulae]KGN71013.1 hypothetical protein HR09_01520 [Porphyromonas gulae]
MKYNPHLNPAEMSYFRLNLLSYLRDAHPDKANDLSFIAARGDMAAEAYSQAIKEGLDHIQAAEIANETLFEGLHFSPYNMLVEILWNEFYDEVSPGEAEEKARVLFPECQAVFAKYHLNDHYADTPEYSILYTELVGIIQLLLEDGLQ